MNQKLNYVIGAIGELKLKIQSIENKHSEEEKENLAKHLADNKILRETLLYSKNNNKLLSNFVGEEKADFHVEIESTFPIKSISELSDLEAKLKDSVFATKLVIILNFLMILRTTKY